MRLLKYIVKSISQQFFYSAGKIIGLITGILLHLFRKQTIDIMFFKSSNIGEFFPDIVFFKKYVNQKYLINKNNGIIYIYKEKEISNLHLDNALKNILLEFRVLDNLEIISKNYNSSVLNGIKKGLNSIKEIFNSSSYMLLPYSWHNFIIRKEILSVTDNIKLEELELEVHLKSLKVDYDFSVDDKYVVLLVNNDLYKMQKSIGGFYNYNHPKSNYGSLRETGTDRLEASLNFLINQNYKVLILGRSISGFDFKSLNKKVIDLSNKIGKSIPDFFDFYLCKHSKIALTTGTGADTILRYYGIKHLKINHYSYNYISNLSDCIILPTIFLNKETRLKASWSEIATIQNKFGIQYNRYFWDQLGIKFMLPDSHDILEATKELVLIDKFGLKGQKNQSNLLWYNKAMELDKYRMNIENPKTDFVMISSNFLTQNKHWLLY